MSEIEVDHERLGLRDGEYVAKLMPVLRMVVQALVPLGGAAASRTCPRVAHCWSPTTPAA